MKVRAARRDMDANRPPIRDAWVSARELLRLFFFDPYDPEWSCDSKRKIGIAKCVAHGGVFLFGQCSAPGMLLLVLSCVQPFDQGNVFNLLLIFVCFPPPPVCHVYLTERMATTARSGRAASRC